jgi:FlaA1/EpsC-like NDP-sugar epimerase
MTDGTRHLTRPVQAFLRLMVGAIQWMPQHIYHRANQLAIDAVLSAMSIVIAFQLRFDFNPPAGVRPVMWLWIMVLPLLRPLTMYALGAYRGIWRYFSMQDALVLVVCAAPTTGVMLLLRAFVANRSWTAAVPYTIAIIEFGVFFALAASVRALRRATFELALTHDTHVSRAIIIGSDQTFAGALRHVSLQRDIQVIGLLAPEEKLAGLRIGGFAVLGDPTALALLLAKRSIDLVLIADATLDCVAGTVSTATEFGVDVRLLPSASNIMRGEVRVAAPPKAESAFIERGISLVAAPVEVADNFRGRTVLVTGAGGSIGSEICRQVVNLPAGRVVLFDNDENSIFEMTKELRTLVASVDMVPLVGDIRDRARVRHVFETYAPDIVLHAAAYKHVPVMEDNCSEAVLNNIAGTRNLAEAALAAGCERFLMISTDKAVNPTSVMGASKRVAELLVQSMSGSGRTRFACVRFGNVVGSRGSVVPIFLKQIAAGEPLTITDEEMTRYFMTIPEAVQLVLQASTLGSNGNIYMLDMGDPIKIKNLARKLIEMSGLRPDKDIEIRVIGRRPGEKIHEELWHQGADVNPTAWSRVFEVRATSVPSTFAEHLQALEAIAAERRDTEVYDLLFATPGCVPDAGEHRSHAAGD